MIYKSCCFTGHRSLSEKEVQVLKHKLEQIIKDLILQGISVFYTGGAIGFDILAAQTVLLYKQKYPGIKLILAIPCKEQAAKWDRQNKLIYEHIMNSSDEIIYVSDNYYNGCMQKRNRFMVDNSKICVCYCIKKTGGTVYTKNYASKKNLRIIDLI